MTTAKEKNFKILFYRVNMSKGNMTEGIIINISD